MKLNSVGMNTLRYGEKQKCINTHLYTRQPSNSGRLGSRTYGVTIQAVNYEEGFKKRSTADTIDFG